MLLAKSTRSGQAPKTLITHSEDVMDAFEALFGTAAQPSRLGQQWLRFFRLDRTEAPAFYANGIAASGLHDVGKANDGLQNAIKKTGEQLLRHEHLSALLILSPVLADWLKNHPLIDLNIVLSAVVGHHLKACLQGSPHYPPFAEAMSAAGQSLTVYADEPEFQQILDSVAQRLGLDRCVVKLPTYWSLSDGGQAVAPLKEELERRFRRGQRELKRAPKRWVLLLAVKAAVIAADAAGSALARENEPITAWLKRAFSEEQLLTGEDIAQAVIQPRIMAIEAARRQQTNPNDPNYHFVFQDFQNEAATLPERALMLAACGAGKTLAAWRWLQARLNERPAARVLFLYPTRATSAEGFRDYVSYAPESDAALLTSTASYELRDLFSNPEDDRTGKNYLTEDRLYALGFWQKRVFSATVDQFLGFLQHSYRSLCLLPVLADSIVVIDEIHSFDVALFSALKAFLETFDVPVLGMTASLPSRRRDELIQLGLQVFPSTSQQFADLQRRAGLPRYRVQHAHTVEQCEELARAAFAAGKRVLWVVNTVDRCQQLARRLDDLQPLCYHSRFRLTDRKTHHQRVIAAFQQSAGSGVIAITTQVCEMSLDLDAQVLISEYAPVPALIQRMGRCNRQAQEAGSPLGEVWLYPPEDELPYNKEDLQVIPEFVTRLGAAPVSQEQLEDLLEQFTKDKAPEPDRLIAFIKDGFWTRGGVEELRDSVNYTVSAVLSNDVDYYLQLRRRGNPIAEGLILPAPWYPRELAQADARLGNNLRVAPSSHYHERYGLCKAPQLREAIIL